MNAEGLIGSAWAVKNADGLIGFAWAIMNAEKLIGPVCNEC